MEKYESKIKVVKGTPEAIFATLTDMLKVKDSLPANIGVNDVEATADECSFRIDKIGRVGICIAEKTPCSMVKYTLKASMPLGINLFAQFKSAPEPTSEPESRLKLTITADIPFMLKPLIGGKLQTLVDNMAASISQRQF